MVIRKLSMAEALVIVEDFDNPLKSVTFEPGERATYVYSTPGKRFFAFHFDNSAIKGSGYLGGEEIDEVEANTYHDDLAPN